MKTTKSTCVFYFNEEGFLIGGDLKHENKIVQSFGYTSGSPETSDCDDLQTGLIVFCDVMAEYISKYIFKCVENN